MIKNYFYTLAVLFSVFSSLPAVGQITANDDTFTINGITGGGSPVSVRQNDVINGNPASQLPCNQAIFTQVSTTNPGVTMNTVCGFINVAPGTPAGTYTLEYQICITETPAVCDTATVTVIVCAITPPVIDSFTPLGCLASTSTISLSGLPATGEWTLTYLNTTTSPEITGTGTTTTLTFPAGFYTFRVTNAEGCTSAPVTLSVYPPQEIEGDLLTLFVDTNGDGIISVGDELHYSIAITNMSECPITDIEILQSTLNFNAATIATLAPGETNATTYLAVYVLTQEDINNGTVFHYAYISGDITGGEAYTKAFSDFSLDIQDGLHLIAFIDSNNNGVQDIGEEEFAGGEFTYQVNGGSVINVTTGTGHHTLYETNAANTYTLGYEINNTACADQYTIQTSGYNNITVPALSGLTNYLFPLTVDPCTDLEAYIYGQAPVPGFNYNNYIIIRNNGNQAIASGTFEYIQDPAVSIVSVSETSAVMTATGFTYSFTNLQPAEAIYVTVTMAVPSLPEVSLGDIFTATVNASIPAGDADPANNSFTINDEVVGAYDPNDKAESHGGRIVYDSFTANDYLTYTIRFENEGTANAQTVRIEDVLDGQLDESTVRMIAASHEYVLERNGSQLEWVFNDIQLPPSIEGTDTGKGFIVFQVKPMPGYAIGTIIENEAGIYFDTNPVIVTNTVVTEFTETLKTPSVTANTIVVYPNPVKDILHIENLNGTGSIEVFNQLGQLVLGRQVNNSQIDLSSLAKGVYMLRLKSGPGEKTIKIIKE